MAGEMWELAATAMGKAIAAGNLAELKKLLEEKDALLFKDRKGNTYLHYACTIYKPHTVNQLLASNIDINHQNRHGNSALHVSAMQSECCHVADLLMSGINPHLKNWEGKTAAELHHKNKYWLTIYNKYMPGIFEAVENRDTENIQKLLQCWTKPDCVRNGQTVRQYAAVLKYHDIVWMLDEQKATSDLLHGVLEVNYTKVCEALTKSKCNVNYINKASKKSHILQYAMSLQDKVLVRLLCDAGADVNTLVTVHHYYKGPLYFEALNTKLPEEILWKILKSGADIKLKDERGRNALIFALDKSNGRIPLSVIEYLIKNGAYIADRDETGVNIRDVARLARRKDIVDYIDKYYVKILRKSDIKMLEKLTVDGYDSIMIQHNSRDTFVFASGNETDDVLQFIDWLPEFEKLVLRLHKGLKTGSELHEIKEIFSICDSPHLLVNTKDKGGRSSVILAVLYDRLDVLEFLLEQPGVEINSQDNCYRTAYHYACHLGKNGEEIRELLKNNQIDTDIVDNVQKKAEVYLNMELNEWILYKRKTLYGMELELMCIDAYEELRQIIRSKNSGLHEFSEKLKYLHLPVSSFAQLLSPVVPDYHDLLFIAVDYNQPDIAKRLADQGSDLSRRELYKIRNEDGERCEKWLTVDERARYLKLLDLADDLLTKKSKQFEGRATLHCDDYNKLIRTLTKRKETLDLKPLHIC
ncbi:putative ankyrin repeat protein RF_0381 [Patella vulgata]|uniref:putative ankyrin repeat protein RF_0381 n=1 Tax=Patella vulgata TaxID=6465 RepID=UPI0021809A55|nr:putative ankyrin repeat protein RF_0381 [Patella vulgata]